MAEKMTITDIFLYIWIGFFLAMTIFSDIDIMKKIVIFIGGVFLIFIIEGILIAFGKKR
jgi:hypothetical protein